MSVSHDTSASTTIVCKEVFDEHSEPTQKGTCLGAYERLFFLGLWGKRWEIGCESCTVFEVKVREWKVEIGVVCVVG